MKKKAVNEKSKKTKKNVEEEIEVLEVWEAHPDEITDAKDRRIKMSKSSTNKIVIALVTIAAFLIMWYSTFAQPLAFNARLPQDDSSWDIGFTAMEVDSIVGSAKELSAPSFTKTKANFYVSLSAPGDKIVYDLTIENKGSIDAKVDSIYIIPENQPNDIIIYSVGGINLGDELKAGQSTHAIVTAMYNRNSGNNGVTRKDMSVIINYKQS